MAIQFGSILAALTWRGAYAGGTVYNLNDAVTSGGSSYRSLANANTGHTPASSLSWWEVIAAKGDAGADGDEGPAGPAPAGTGLAEVVGGALVTPQRRGVLPPVRLAWVGPDAATVTGVAPILTLTANANGALGAIDGETPAVGDRILTLYGADARSLVWVVTSLGDAGAPWTATLAPDNASPGQLYRGVLAQVSDGATYGDGKVWRVSTTGAITPGTTVVAWEVKLATTASAAAYTPGDAGDWSGSAPTTYAEALDRIAAAIGPIA